MASISAWLPLTHGIAAAREVAAGAPLTDVAPVLGAEAGLGAIYIAVGLGLLALFERESRRQASLEAF